MAKKYYIFLILIFFLLSILYSIITHKYWEYKISEHKKSIFELNIEIQDYITKANEIIKYKKSEAYKNKILKQDKLKNKSEIVTYIKTEDQYNIFVEPIEDVVSISKKQNKILDETYGMGINQKWLWFLFKKDLR